MKRFAFILVILVVSNVVAAETIHRELQYQPGPVLNPLKGFVPYSYQGKDFPHTMEFSYLPMRAMMIDWGKYDFDPLEKKLNDNASRGCQTVFRIYLEYPGKETGIPQFLLDNGIKTNTYMNTNTHPFPPKKITTPDYEDKQLRTAMTDFIAELGKRYDGDPRIGFITAGLLGTWGEWHTHPRTELWASKQVQLEVMNAYENAFKKTHVLLRYPAGENDYAYASNTDCTLGYHDDSFGWATLDTGNKSDSWFFMAKMNNAGQGALDRWKSHAIGGEIRPELWNCLWNENACQPKGQDFAECVQQTHATWLMDSSVNRKLTDDQRTRALKAAQSLGYDLYVKSVKIVENNGLDVEISIINKGVAPFYYNWPVYLGIIDQDGKVIKKWKTSWSFSKILPNQSRLYKYDDIAESLSKDVRFLAVAVPNPMKDGVWLGFANAEQDKHAKGWLTLAELHD